MAERDRVETAERSDRGDRAEGGEQAEQDADAHGSHGHSIAAWVCVGTVLLGCLVMSVAVVAALIWLFVVGAVVVGVGMVLGKVLHGMGFGEPAQGPPPHPSKEGVR